MTLPGTTVTIAEEAAARYSPPSPSTFFVAGFTERGTHSEPIPVSSLAEYVNRAGGRVSYGSLYDAIDVFGREGGTSAYVLRVLGPDPVLADADLHDASGSTSGDISLSATAKEYGAWADSLNLVVTNSGSDYQVVVTHDDGTELETSPVFTTRAEAVAWDSDYVTFALGVSTEIPRTQTVSFAGGDDDRSNATDTEWAAALELATRDYGPGLVAMPGHTSADGHEALLAHAHAFNRVALLDLDDTAVVADLVADIENLRDLDGARFAGAFAPWATVPGVVRGTTRTVPYSAVQAGLIARSQGLGNSPNVAAAGANGQSRYAVGLSQDPFSEADRETLNDAGVNLARVIRGAVRTYGYRALVDELTDDNWVQLTGALTATAIAAEGDQVAERYLFAEIDGRGLKIAEFGGEIAAVCLGYYNRNALYGETPDEAFAVDVGPEVNPVEQIAAGVLKARVSLRTSPFAERTEIEITKVRTAESL
jgi:phage tail sheath protein FI